MPAAVAEGIADAVAGQYRALEIDGRRSFGYESVYFDTPDLRCFTDHLEGRHPRFKLRSRYYRDTDACFFEVKVKARRPDDQAPASMCEKRTGRKTGGIRPRPAGRSAARFLNRRTMC